ncbi:mycothiol-dependent maleylpyruvate isomerase NagL [Brevibacterium daeguense]|uniref:Mycothiol-dependent maleylpyruvate isomerase NagL n=2 Tax=Brevibacterium daeguense TaxID=909936 RepID=A0ABP8EKH2_9MICO
MSDRDMRQVTRAGREPENLYCEGMEMNQDDLERDLGFRLLGEKFYLQALDQLSLNGLDEPSVLPGWTRKHVALHVTFNAEGFLRLLDWAKTGVENRMYPSREARDRQIEEAAAHTSGADTMTMAHEVAEELTEELGTMPEAAWSADLISGRGEPILAADIPWLRAREVWVHSLDLGIGMTTRDFPAEVVDRLLADVEDVWRRRDEPVHYRIALTDRPDRDEWVIASGPADQIPAQPVPLSGEAAEVLSFLTGRGWPNSVAEDEGKGGAGNIRPVDLPAPPPWL